MEEVKYFRKECQLEVNEWMMFRSYLITFTLYNFDLYQLKFKKMDSNVKLQFDISNITSDAAMK